MNPPITEYRKFLFFCAVGSPYIVSLLVVCCAATFLGLRSPKPLLIGAAVLLWAIFAEVCYFFRDPQRDAPHDSRIIVAPADGKIIGIRPEREESFMHGECVRISIFMNIFSVHVNRAPVTGRVTYCHYNPGKFISAFKEKASLDNEQVLLGLVKEENGKEEMKVLIKLIAGLIARRIVVWKGLKTIVSQGERISLIKFGSRVDVYLPLHVTVSAKEGDWVRAGESVIGIIP